MFALYLKLIKISQMMSILVVYLSIISAPKSFTGEHGTQQNCQYRQNIR